MCQTTSMPRLLSWGTQVTLKTLYFSDNCVGADNGHILSVPLRVVGIQRKLELGNYV